MRKLIAEIFDPATRYEYELPLPADVVRALEFDAEFKELAVGLVHGSVAAVAERRRVYRVLATDRRDFGAIRVGQRFTQPLELVRNTRPTAGGPAAAGSGERTLTTIVADAYTVIGDQLTVDRQMTVLARPEGHLVTLANLANNQMSIVYRRAE